jgi:hypothetical protein
VGNVFFDGRHVIGLHSLKDRNEINAFLEAGVGRLGVNRRMSALLVIEALPLGDLFFSAGAALLLPGVGNAATI